jgi:hypothetical protein
VLNELDFNLKNSLGKVDSIFNIMVPKYNDPDFLESRTLILGFNVNGENAICEYDFKNQQINNLKTIIDT